MGPSRLWATLGHGILNEVYWPATGQPQLRDLGFIVAGDGFWVEVKRVASYAVSTPAPHLPLPRAVHRGEGYRLVLEFLPDPARDVLLLSYELAGDGVRLYPLLAPHLGVSGWDNGAWVDAGLFARRDDRVLCLLADPPFVRASAGYVGASDGWQDFARHGRMTWTFTSAPRGNVALMGELDASAGVLALAFAQTPEGARTLAASSLADGYERARGDFIAQWTEWGRHLSLPSGPSRILTEARLSATMLRVHEDRRFPGAVVASLSIPWGNTRNDPGGYHLVWTRDAVEAAFGLMAAGQLDDARRILTYLAATQNDDGGWSQNFFPDGRPHWTGIQLDQVAFPVVLAECLSERGMDPMHGSLDMIRRAVAYIARNGPLSPQDRWEENGGASPFTIAVEVAALVAASRHLDAGERDYALGLADCWNERIEEWTYVHDTALAREIGVEGYYVRIGPLPQDGGLCGRIEVYNRPHELVEASALVGLEFIYLVRLGLRRADDPRIRATTRVVDAQLRVETPCGSAYHRYNGDGYGEHEDGSAFDGTGIGRGWPLLVGERGHLALMQGEDPLPYLEAMTCMTGRCGLIPEQVWDAAPIADRGLTPGKPTGAAMPLVWAHAEFVKLYVARKRRRPLELLEVVRERYAGKVPSASVWYWRSDVPFGELPHGKALVIEDARPFVLHFGFDGWQEAQDRPAQPLGLGMYGVAFARSELRTHRELEFTRYYTVGHWEGHDHAIALGRGAPRRR